MVVTIRIAGVASGMGPSISYWNFIGDQCGCSGMKLSPDNSNAES